MALKTVNNMAKILQKMFSDGKKLHDPEVIQMSLEPGIRSRSEQVSGQCCKMSETAAMSEAVLWSSVLEPATQ